MRRTSTPGRLLQGGLARAVRRHGTQPFCQGPDWCTLVCVRAEEPKKFKGRVETGRKVCWRADRHGLSLSVSRLLACAALKCPSSPPANVFARLIVQLRRQCVCVSVCLRMVAGDHEAACSPPRRVSTRRSSRPRRRQDRKGPGQRVSGSQLESTDLMAQRKSNQRTHPRSCARRGKHVQGLARR